MSVIKSFTSERYDDKRRLSVSADVCGAMFAIDGAGLSIYLHLDIADLETLQATIASVLASHTQMKEAA